MRGEIGRWLPSRRLWRRRSGRKRGKASAASPVPCRAGKLRVKIFSEAGRAEKSSVIIYFGHDAQQQSKAWQGNGRESPKSIGSPSGIVHC
jgi:hypothetical protein